MYIPKINLLEDQDEIVSFMKQFSFATIVTAANSFPVATHLPFIIARENDSIVLTSHFAWSNEHWKNLENNTSLVIFSEPHAYISPSLYDKELNVPTWNYISIHAYGKGRIISEPGQVISLLESTIDNYEKEYREQWNGLPQDYKMKMSKGIVAFDITVTDLQAKKKLSQNRTESEQLRIIHSLSNSSDTNEKLIAEFMKENLPAK